MRLNLAEELVARGYTVDLVLCRREGELLSSVAGGVNIVDLGAKRTVTSLIPLVRYLNRRRPAVLFSSLGHQNIISIVAARISGSRSKIVVTQHNALGEESSLNGHLSHRLLPGLYRVFLPFADHVLAVSEGVADDLSFHSKFDRRRISVIYNPVVRGAIRTLATEPVVSFPPDAGKDCVIAVGRLSPQKNFDHLLRAFAQVARRRAVSLAICGVGDLYTDLRALCDELGISERVHFLGFQKNPFKYISRASLLVMSSRYEGFGNVIAESLACGTPVVSTDCKYGPSEILDNGRFGRLVPLDDLGALAVAIDEELSRQHDKAALVSRANMFAVDRICDAYLNLVGLPLELDGRVTDYD